MKVALPLVLVVAVLLSMLALVAPQEQQVGQLPIVYPYRLLFQDDKLWEFRNESLAGKIIYSFTVPARTAASHLDIYLDCRRWVLTPDFWRLEVYVDILVDNEWREMACHAEAFEFQEFNGFDGGIFLVAPIKEEWGLAPWPLRVRFWWECRGGMMNGLLFRKCLVLGQ